MILYVPLPGSFKFNKVFSENEYLQEVLTEEPNSVSVWYVSAECDIEELERILVAYKINYRLRRVN